MSGGHFEHAWVGVSTFAGDLEHEILASDYSDKTKHDLMAIQQKCCQMADEMRAVEWLFSGDSGEDTFAQELKQIRERHSDILHPQA